MSVKILKPKTLILLVKIWHGIIATNLALYTALNVPILIFPANSVI